MDASIKLCWGHEGQYLIRYQRDETFIRQSNVKPREARQSATKVVNSRVTSYRVHSWNMSLQEELVGTEFTRELMGLVGGVKHT